MQALTDDIVFLLFFENLSVHVIVLAKRVLCGSFIFIHQMAGTIVNREFLFRCARLCFGNTSLKNNLRSHNINYDTPISHWSLVWKQIYACNWARSWKSDGLDTGWWLWWRFPLILGRSTTTGRGAMFVLDLALGVGSAASAITSKKESQW